LQTVALRCRTTSDAANADSEQKASTTSATDFYPPLFQAAFGTPQVTRERISRALAQFVQALISYRAKVDRGAQAHRRDR
jgi:cytochrome c peroxidase